MAQENTADASKHSVLAGRAPAGAILRLTKTFETPTSQEGQTVTDHLNSDDPGAARTASSSGT